MSTLLNIPPRALMGAPDYPLPAPSPRVLAPLAGVGLLAVQAATAGVLLGRIFPWPLIATMALVYAAGLCVADRRARIDAEDAVLAHTLPAPREAVEVLEGLCDRLGRATPRLLMTPGRRDLGDCRSGAQAACCAGDAIVYAQPDCAQLNGGEFQALLAHELAHAAQGRHWIRRGATSAAAAVVLAAAGAAMASRPAAAFLIIFAATVTCRLGFLALARARQHHADLVAVRATASPRLGFAIQALSAPVATLDAGTRARFAVSDDYLEHYIGRLNAAVSRRGLRRRMHALLSVDADPVVRLRRVIVRGQAARSVQRWGDPSAT